MTVTTFVALILLSFAALGCIVSILVCAAAIRNRDQFLHGLADGVKEVFRSARL